MKRFAVLIALLCLTASLSAEDCSGGCCACWCGELGLGLNVLTGNSDVREVEGSFELHRKYICQKCLQDEVLLDGDYDHKRSNHTTKVHKGYLRGRYSRYFAPCWMWLISEKYGFDSEKEIRGASKAVIGIAYRWNYNSCVTMYWHGGVGHLDTYYSDDTRADEHDFTIALGNDLTWDLPYGICLKNELEYITTLDFSNHFTISDITKICYPLAPCWKLSLDHEYSYDSVPGFGKKNWDSDLTMKLCYKF